MRYAQSILVALWVCFAATSAPAQSVRDDSAYSHEAAELHARIYALLQRGIRADTDTEQLSVAEEQLLLVRRVHALSEDAERADLAVQKEWCI
jgi:hypothetical protein